MCRTTFTTTLFFIILLVGCSNHSTEDCIIERRGPNSAVVRVSGDCRGHNFAGIDLSAADVSGADWAGAICPDGTSSYENEQGCLGHLTPSSSDNEGLDQGGDFKDASNLDQAQADQEALSDTEPVDSFEEDTAETELSDLPDEPEEDLVEPDMQMNIPVTNYGACDQEGRCFERCLWISPAGGSPTGFAVFGGPLAPWTIEGWVYLAESQAQPMTMLSTRLGNTDDPHLTWRALGQTQFDFVQLELQVNFEGDSRSLRTNERVLPVGQWVHVALDSELVWHINGRRVTSHLYGDETQEVDSNTFFRHLIYWKMGAPASTEPSQGLWNGTIREVRISTGIRYTNDFVPEHFPVDDAQTLTLWHLDEGEGGLLHGSSRNEDLPVLMPDWRVCPQ